MSTSLSLNDFRPEVIALAFLMESQLKRNDGRGGWKACDRVYLMERLDENLRDLGYNLRAGDKAAAAQTCADIANFVMMMADNEGMLPEVTQTSQPPLRRIDNEL